MTKPQTIQEAGEEFMMHLGMCITEWAHIEEDVFTICRHLLRTTLENTAIVYYRTPTLDSRIGLAVELVATVLPTTPENGKHAHKDAKTWTQLVIATKAQFPIRNQLAHSPVGATLVDGSGNWLRAVSQGVAFRFESYPHPQEKARGKLSKKPLGLADLKTHLTAVAALHVRFRDFEHLLRAHLPKP